MQSDVIVNWALEVFLLTYLISEQNKKYQL